MQIPLAASDLKSDIVILLSGRDRSIKRNINRGIYRGWRDTGNIDFQDVIICLLETRSVFSSRHFGACASGGLQ